MADGMSVRDTYNRISQALDLGKVLWRFEIDGVTYEAPFDLDFSDLTVAEVHLASELAVDAHPAAPAAAMLFVKAQRHVPELTVDYFDSFLEVVAAMSAGDGSMIQLGGAG